MVTFGYLWLPLVSSAPTTTETTMTDPLKAPPHVRTPDLLLRVEGLRGEAQSRSHDHLDDIKAALALVDVSIGHLEALGLTVDVSWPYGRGAVAKAASTTVRLSISGLRI